jgi:hypothetical protein
MPSIIQMKLRQIIVNAMMFALAGGSLHAQQIKFGVKAGLNLSSVKFDYNNNNNNTSSILRFNTGLLSEVSLGKKCLLRPEILYSMQGWKFSPNNTNSGGSLNLHYLTMPVLFGYKPISKLSILAGPQVAFLMKATRKETNVQSVTVNNLYRNFDYGICFGSAYKLTEKLGIELRYFYGFKTLFRYELRDNNNYPTGKIQRDGANRVLQLNVFYLFDKIN